MTFFLIQKHMQFMIYMQMQKKNNPKLFKNILNYDRNFHEKCEQTAQPSSECEMLQHIAFVLKAF